MSFTHRLTAAGPAAKLCLAAFVAATAQISFVSTSLANPGDLYVTDLATGSIVVYTPDGTATTFATGLISPQGVVFDQAKNLYVADAGDGTNGSGSIIKYDLLSKTPTLVRDGLNNPVGLALDGSDLLVSDSGLDRVLRMPLGTGHAPSVFQILTGPLGLASHGFNQSGFNRFIANGLSVLKIAPDGTTTDIDPGDNSRAVAVTTVQLNDPAEVVFVTTDDGTVTRLINDMKDPTPFASGLVDPNGMDFRPARFGGDTEGVGDLYVADRAAGQILIVKPGVAPEVFATGGQPNFLVFETNGPAPAGKALNISTRVDVETGDNVAIGGFIITGGSEAKTVVIRALGSSLGSAGVANPLSDPVLELHEPDGTVRTNNDWKDNSAADQGVIVAAGLDMYGSSVIDDSESVMVATLPPRDLATAGSGEFTAVVRGNGGATGVGLVEVYDLDDPTVVAELGNISTRGIVGTVDDVLIGGLIVGPIGGLDTSVVVRAIGPSLANATSAVADALDDPFLELHNVDGDTIAANDNWQDGDNADLIDGLQLAPSEDAEAAIFANLVPGEYTAIVMGNNNAVGVALVEIFHVPTPAAQ